MSFNRDPLFGFSLVWIRLRPDWTQNATPRPIQNFRSWICAPNVAMLSAVVLILFAFLVSTALGQNISVGVPAEVGMSAERLARIGRVMTEYVAGNKLAGVAVLVSRRGEAVYFYTTGFADRDSEAPIKSDTIYWIASMTKPIVSVALMTLFEEGRFQLDDPVSRYIPAFAETLADTDPEDGTLVTEPLKRPLTIRHLLTHTSGITYGTNGSKELLELYRGLPFQAKLDEWTVKLAGVPLNQQPGTRFHYGLSVDVQGYLIEVLSGQELDVFLKDRIFGPLGMEDTGFFVPAEELSRLATVYGPAERPGGELKTIAEADDPQRAQKPNFLSGGGGLFSTLPDYYKFCQMLLNRGKLAEARILGSPTVQLMTQNHIPAEIGELEEDPGNGFGLGFRVVLDPIKAGSPGSQGEYNWGGAASTLFWIDPEEELIAILMTHLIPTETYPLREQLRALVYQAIID